MKKIFLLSLFLCCFATINHAFSQTQLYGMTSDGGAKNGGNIFSLNTDGTGFTVRDIFLGDGQTPYGQTLVAYGDGFMYGTVGFGGTGQGVLFKMMPDGTSYSVIYNFQNATGYYPYGGVIKGQDGFLYGTTSQGGLNGYGVIYKVSTSGSGYQVLHHFTGTDGAFSQSALFQYSNGTLYGTTMNGGTSNKGTVFSINPDGTGFQVLHSFNGTDGALPAGALLSVTLNSSDYIYGITSSGGSSNLGVIYRFLVNSPRYELKYTFNSTSGSNAGGGLLKIGAAGVVLFGTARNSGNLSGGTIFSYNASTNVFNLLHTFSPRAEYFPTAPLISVNGVLYGSTENGGTSSKGVLFSLNTDGSGYQVLANYPDQNRFGNLLFSNSFIYGLTTGGQVTGGYSDGTIYRTNTNGTGYTLIHGFNDPQGYSPSGSLIQGQDGKLYGMTTLGGSGYSNGVLFSVNTNGLNYNVLALLGNGPSDGNPQGSPNQTSDGSIYGLNYNGGTSFTGNIFKATVSPLTYQAFNVFCLAPGCASHPKGSLLQASDGNLYGMASQSGTSNTFGSIFKINTSGTGYTDIHDFISTDGRDPSGSLIEGPDGFLYGMTPNGGTDNYGVIFKISKTGLSFSTLFNFSPGGLNQINGIHPQGSLKLGTDNKLYGMTQGGGANQEGAIFKINTDGTNFQVIYNFNSTSGIFPVGSLIQENTTGFLYGMTPIGGSNNFGTVFKIQTDGTGFQKLLDFTGANGKYPKGDLLLVSTGMMMTSKGPSAQLGLETTSSNFPLLTAYPNPAKNIFNIALQAPETGKIGFSLIDPMGRTVKQVVAEKPTATLIQQWDLSHLPSGVYLLKVQTSTRQFTKTIIKQ